MLFLWVGMLDCFVVYCLIVAVWGWFSLIWCDCDCLGVCSLRLIVLIFVFYNLDLVIVICYN